MELSIGSYKFRVEILIALVVVAWILFGHLLCSCSRIGLLEGFALSKQIAKEALTTPRITDKDREKQIGTVGTIGAINQVSSKEGFVSASTASGPQFSDAKAPDYYMDPNKWAMPTLTYSPGTTPSAGVQAIWDRKKQQIPLPEGQLDVFAKTDFSPDCCPNTYSTSMGCACMDVGTYNYLRDRGGNNVPYSEY